MRYYTTLDKQLQNKYTITQSAISPRTQLKEESLRNRKQCGNGKSVKVRDLQEDLSRTVSIGVKSAGLTTAEEIVFRMRRGIPLATEERVDFREGNDITRRKLNAFTAQVFKHHRSGHRS